MRSPGRAVLLHAAAWSITAIAGSGDARASTPFVSEIHYDNAGTDEGEAIEIVGTAGLDLLGWQLVLYNGATGAAYATLTLSGVVPSEREGHGAVAFALPTNGLQNGPDGIALVDVDGNVVEFLAYEGTLRAADGPAAGLSASDVGASESGDTPVGTSLQRVGIGTEVGVWLTGQPSSFGLLNAAQGFGEPWPSLAIPALQGAGHRSPWEGVGVRVTGVVTAVTGDGFYLQDPVGDGEPATSDAVFAYTGTEPELAAGDVPIVDGVVSEIVPPGGAFGLSVTELAVVRLAGFASAPRPLPAPTRIGASGRAPPSRVMDDDDFESFEPERDGIDFWESLEGMRTLLPESRSVDATNVFGETFVVVDGGRDATGLSARGALVAARDDSNPERVRVRDDYDLTPEPADDAQVGDGLGDVVGILDYAFGSFELRATESFAIDAGGLAAETRSLPDAPGVLTLGSYNVMNLDPADGARFDAIASHLVHALGEPDVVVLQEVQDSDGPTDSGEVGSDETARLLREAILRESGPAYEYVDLPPEDGEDGGQPGANIRVGFLYDPRRVSPEPGSVRRLLDPDLGDGDAFAGSRKPLLMEFRFSGRRVVLIGVHLTSRAGGSPAFGAIQPPRVGGAARRLAQAAVLRAFAADTLARAPETLLVVAGDWNELPFGEPIELLEREGPGRLRALSHRLPTEERYSFLFEGSAELLDHVLVSPILFRHAALDVVHVNAELTGGASDHDPILARLDIAAAPEPARGPGALAALVAIHAAASVARRRARGAARATRFRETPPGRHPGERQTLRRAEPPRGAR